jgi:hypothetical protein
MSIDYQDYKKEKKPKKEYGYAPRGDVPNEVKNLMQYTDTADNKYFVYRTYDGAIQGYVIRKEAHETKDGKKKFTPYSYDLANNKWCPNSWSENRCLYNEDKLKDNIKPVLVSEGEKAAAYGNKHYKDYLHVSWSGGSKAVHKTNYKHLKDKEVILFPDNDDDGIRAMSHVAKILIEGEITTNIKIVDVKDLPDKFDIADEPNHPQISIQGIINTAKEFDPDNYIEYWQKIAAAEEKRDIESQVEKFLKVYIYVRSVMSFYELWPRKELLNKTQINDWNYSAMRGHSLDRALLKNKNLIKVHSVFTHAGMKPGVVEVKHGQHEAIDQGIYFNTYRPTMIAAEPGDVSDILDYYKWLLGENNWHWIEQYIAYMVQNPGKKVRWAPVIVSVEGGGKGLLASLISSLLGHHNCNTQLQYEQMVNQFSNILMGLQFGIINELDLSSRKNIKQLTNALKKFITDDTLTIELKGRPQIKIPFFCNFIIYSNDADCLHLTKDSRRYLIIQVKQTQEDINEKLDSGTKDLILDALEFGSDKIKHLLYHFKNIEIKDAKAFQRNAPKTEDFYNVVERSRPDIHRVLDERLKNNQWPFQFDGKWNQEEHEYKTDKETGKQYITNTKYRTKQCFSGMVVASDLYETLIQDPILKKEYITRDLILDWCTENHTPWPNGKPSKQIKLPINTYPRAHLIKDYEVNGVKLSTMTEGQLGDHYYFHTYDTIEHSNNSVQYSRNENKQKSPNYKPKQVSWNY